MSPSSWRDALRWPHWQIAPRWVALALSLWCSLALNQAWWGKLAQVGSEQRLDGLQHVLVFMVLTAATYLWFMLLSWPVLRKGGWTLSLVVAAAVQYFMLHYGIVVDTSMVRNALQTNASEGWALMGPGLLAHVLIYAGLPALVLWGCVRFKPESKRRAVARSGVAIVLSVCTVLSAGLWLYKPMAPLVRNHPEVRYLINPLATVVALSQVTLKPLFKTQRAFRTISEGATLGMSYGSGGHAAAAARKPPLLVLVVGETTRADHFGLNGYPRNTTPAMAARQVVSWRNVRSCGTNTLASVPCMFSHLGKQGFESRKFEYENLLDVLQHAGLQVDWLDNQSGCKEVCQRISHAQADQVASAAEQHLWCKDSECLDQLMVGLLDQRLQALDPQGKSAGVVLVLHTMGSHGPAYYRRSSAASKQFQPECATHVTSECSQDELVNVYDNSMLETDRFVGRTIDWLQTQQARYDVGLMYLSDHGESLGENGLYLHGLPYVIAPDTQKHVPWVLWPGSLLGRSRVAEGCVRAGTETALTHDNYYHTVLGMLDVHSPTYQTALDALSPCRTPGA